MNKNLNYVLAAAFLAASSASAEVTPDAQNVSFSSLGDDLVSGASFTPYEGQDQAGAAGLTVDTTVSLKGNSWKVLQLPETITVSENTVLSFDYEPTSISTPEFRGLMPIVEGDNAYSQSDFIRLGGSAAFGLEPAVYDKAAGGKQDITVRLADYFPEGTQLSDLAFISDDDRSYVPVSPEANFGNMIIHEGDPSNAVNLFLDASGSPIGENDFTSFQGQDETGAEGLDIDHSFSLTGNSWQVMEFENPITVTDKTWVTFNYCSSGAKADFQGVMFMPQGTTEYNEDVFLRLGGDEEFNGNYKFLGRRSTECGDSVMHEAEVSLSLRHSPGTVISGVVLVNDHDQGYAPVSPVSNYSDMIVFEGFNRDRPEAGVPKMSNVSSYKALYETQEISLSPWASISQGAGGLSIARCITNGDFTSSIDEEGNCVVSVGQNADLESTGAVSYSVVDRFGSLSNSRTINLSVKPQPALYVNMNPDNFPKPDEICAYVSYYGQGVAEILENPDQLNAIVDGRLAGSNETLPENVEMIIHRPPYEKASDGIRDQIVAAPNMGSVNTAFGMAFGAVYPDDGGKCDGYAAAVVGNPKDRFKTELLHQKSYIQENGSLTAVNKGPEVVERVLMGKLWSNYDVLKGYLSDFSGFSPVDECVELHPDPTVNTSGTGATDQIECIANGGPDIEP